MRAVDKEIVRAAALSARRSMSMRGVYLIMLAKHYAVPDGNLPRHAPSATRLVFGSHPSFYQFRYWASLSREAIARSLGISKIARSIRRIDDLRVARHAAGEPSTVPVRRQPGPLLLSLVAPQR
jgi:hypothetical protein